MGQFLQRTAEPLCNFDSFGAVQTVPKACQLKLNAKNIRPALIASSLNRPEASLQKA